MGLFDFIGPSAGLLFTLENIIWINLGVFIGCVFAAIPGLSVILCIILFLPVTYTMKAIPGMMFLLGIYCAGGYGGSVSAILINTPGTPHAAATMLDGHPLSKMGRTKAALKIALYASTFGGIFSALVLLFLAAYHIGKWLPMVRWDMYKDHSQYYGGEDNKQLLSRETTTNNYNRILVGLNYQLFKNVTIQFNYHHFFYDKKAKDAIGYDGNNQIQLMGRFAF